MYSYVGNDPVNRMDPTGLFWGKLWRAIKKIVTSKWFQIALAVAIIVIAHYYPNSIFGFLGGGSSGASSGAAGAATAPVLQTAATGAGAVAARAAPIAATNAAFAVGGVAALEGATVGLSLAADIASLGLAGALAAGQIGGQFSSAQQKQVEDTKKDVKNRLQNPDCAGLLGGLRNAQALLRRANVLNANTLSPSYKGTAGLYSKAANIARSEASNPSGFFAYSEGAPLRVNNGRTVLPKNIYLTNRFFSENLSQQATLFIHELNRLKGYTGGYQEDYVRITKACGTANP